MQGKDPDLCWNEGRKREELRDERAWFLLARTEGGDPVAFSHFRWERGGVGWRGVEWGGVGNLVISVPISSF